MLVIPVTFWMIRVQSMMVIKGKVMVFFLVEMCESWFPFFIRFFVLVLVFEI